jgi:hypothetical protein
MAIVITIIWATAYLMSFFNPDLHAPPELSGIMLAVVTWLFGTEIKNRLKGNGK